MEEANVVKMYNPTTKHIECNTAQPVISHHYYDSDGKLMLRVEFFHTEALSDERLSSLSTKADLLARELLSNQTKSFSSSMTVIGGIYTFFPNDEKYWLRQFTLPSSDAVPPLFSSLITTEEEARMYSDARTAALCNWNPALFSWVSEVSNKSVMLDAIGLPTFKIAQLETMLNLGQVESDTLLKEVVIPDFLPHEITRGSVNLLTALTRLEYVIDELMELNMAQFKRFLKEAKEQRVNTEEEVEYVWLSLICDLKNKPERLSSTYLNNASLMGEILIELDRVVEKRPFHGSWVQTHYLNLVKKLAFRTPHLGKLALISFRQMPRVDGQTVVSKLGTYSVGLWCNTSPEISDALANLMIDKMGVEKSAALIDVALDGDSPKSPGAWYDLINKWDEENLADLPAEWIVDTM